MVAGRTIRFGGPRFEYPCFRVLRIALQPLHFTRPTFRHYLTAQRIFFPPVTPLPNAGLGALIIEVPGSHTDTHTHTDTDTGSTPLDEWSARLRCRYIHKTQQIPVTISHAHSGIGTRDRSNQATADFTAIGIELNFLLLNIISGPEIWVETVPHPPDTRASHMLLLPGNEPTKIAGWAHRDVGYGLHQGVLRF